MIAITFIDSIPLWLLSILTAALALLSIELGWQLGNTRHRRNKGESNISLGAAVGATLGLLAFLLAFTFGMAGSRFDTRKQNVLLEANAIGTTYLRVDFLPEELRDPAREFLREYTVLRAGGAAAYMSAEGMARAAAIHDELWAIAGDAKTISNTVTTGQFIQSLNELIDLDEIRVTGYRNRIPDTIWVMLGLVTFYSMIAIGYESGLTGVRNWAVTILLTVVFTTVIVLIADLDRPQTGLIQVSQQPLLDLLNKIGTPMP
jgi:hypothetical protein